MLSILDQEYPAPRPTKRSITTSILFGLFIGLFLWFFEPFDINLSTGEDDVSDMFFYGLITTVVLLIFLCLLPLLLPKYFLDKNWRVKHQMLYYLTILFVIATVNGIYTNYINNLSFTWANYWWMISRTFVLGGIPIAFITLIDYHRKSSLNIKQAEDIPIRTNIHGTENSNHSYQIVTDLKTETIQFDEDDFYYAVAVGNYIDLYSMSDGVMKKETYRVSLSSFEDQLVSPSLKRCHRSYVVNLNKVDSISGNAQGLKIALKNHPDIIPVSRKYIPNVRAYYVDRQ